MSHEKSSHEKVTLSSYRQAISGPDKLEWSASMNREWYAHSINETFTLVPKPPHRSADGKKHIVM
jgi:hypothetical protein